MKIILNSIALLSLIGLVSCGESQQERSSDITTTSIASTADFEAEESVSVDDVELSKAEQEIFEEEFGINFQSCYAIKSGAKRLVRMANKKGYDVAQAQYKAAGCGNLANYGWRRARLGY